jgi:tetratricopeptide (TPR) repeat protein
VSQSISPVEGAGAEYEQCRTAYGPEDPLTLTAQVRLARAYYEEGQFRKAEGLYSSAFAMRGRLVGFDDPSAVSAGFGLAGAYMKSEDWTSARPVLEDLLKRSDRVNGTGSDMSRHIAINLAITYRQLARYGDELPLRQRILANTRETLGFSPLDTGRSLVDLANALEKLGNYEMAMSVNQEAIVEFEAEGVSIHQIVLCKWHMA